MSINTAGINERVTMIHVYIMETLNVIKNVYGVFVQNRQWSTYNKCHIRGICVICILRFIQVV